MELTAMLLLGLTLHSIRQDNIMAEQKRTKV